MVRYIKYFSYVIRHKWFVMIECFKVRLYWRGIVHDNSKFFPSEFIPYAKHFYDKNGSKKSVRDKTGYYKPTDTGDISFDLAWFYHQKQNSHHWQYWILPDDSSGVKLIKIPAKYILEMICDWKGAGRAQGTPNVMKWYEKNKNKLQLHDESRLFLEEMLKLYA